MDPPPPTPFLRKGLEESTDNLERIIPGIYTADRRRIYIQGIRNLVRRLPDADHLLMEIDESRHYDLRFDFVTEGVLRKAFDDISRVLGRTPLLKERYTGRSGQFRQSIIYSVQRLLGLPDARTSSPHLFTDIDAIKLTMGEFLSMGKGERKLEDIFGFDEMGRDLRMSNEDFEKMFLEPLDIEDYNDDSLFAERFNMVGELALTTKRMYNKRLSIVRTLVRGIEYAVESLIRLIPHPIGELGPFYVYYEQMFRTGKKDPETSFDPSKWYHVMVWLHIRARLNDLNTLILHEVLHRLEFFITQVNFIPAKVYKELHWRGLFRDIFLYYEDVSFLSIERRIKPKQFRKKIIERLERTVYSRRFYTNVENYARLAVWMQNIPIKRRSFVKNVLLLHNHLQRRGEGEEESDPDTLLHRTIRSVVENLEGTYAIPEEFQTPKALLSPIVPDPAQLGTDPNVVSHFKRYLGPEGSDDPKWVDSRRWLATMLISSGLIEDVLNMLKVNLSVYHTRMGSFSPSFTDTLETNPDLPKSDWIEWQRFLSTMLAIKELTGSLIRRRLFYEERIVHLNYFKDNMNPTQMTLLVRRSKEGIPLMEYLFLTKVERTLGTPADYTTPDITGDIEDEEWESQILYH
jgi:hypothetical protein